MTGSAGGRRRLIGAVVLLLALTGVVALNRMSGAQVSGHPVATWPQPPPVGSCLDLDGAGPRTVPCDGPHDAEVTAAYGPLDPMVTDTARDPMYDACAAAAHAYLGPVAAGTPIPDHPGWNAPGPDYQAKPLEAPADQRVGRYGWSVCVVQPEVPIRYTGTVRNVSGIDLPAAYRACRGGDGALLVSCALPHAAEVLAVHSNPGAGSSEDGGSSAPDQAASAAAQAEVGALAQANRAAVSAREAGVALAALSGQCSDIAASVIGTLDPSYRGLLTVTVEPGGGPRYAHITSTLNGDAGPDGVQTGPTLRSWMATVGCTVRAADGRLLAGSMVGWGDRQPPLTGK